MTQPPLPRYSLPQPDGSEVVLDFTAPGPFGDFAFRVEFPDGTSRLIGAYHTTESSIFVVILQHWARLPRRLAAEVSPRDARLP